MSDIKKVNKSALLGNSNEKSNKVYISPSTGKVSDKPGADSIAVPPTMWYLKSGGELNSPLFSVPQIRDKIKHQASEMAVYFPDFELYEDSETVFYDGKIAGIGETRVIYPQTWPSQKFKIEALDLDSSFNDELNRLVWSYDGITAAGALIAMMRLFLLENFGSEKNAVVPSR